MPRPDPPPLPPALVLAFGVAAVSTGAIFVRLASPAPALTIAFWRCLIASGALLPFALPRLRRELRGLERRDYALLAASGFFLALHFASWITSLDYTSVASSVLFVNTGPIWVGLLTPLLSRDRIGRGMAVGIGVAFVGSAIVGGGDHALRADALYGDFLAVLGAVALSLYLLSGRHLRVKLSLASYATLCYGIAALTLLLIALLSDTALTGFDGSTWGWLVACALVPQLAGHTISNWALKWATAALVAVSLLGEPLGSTLLAALFLDEQPGTAFYLGAPWILAGIAGAAWAEKRPKRGPSPP